MGKYRAKFSVPNHLFGTVKDYDDSDPIVLARVKSGMLERIDEPAGAPEKPADDVKTESVEEQSSVAEAATESEDEAPAKKAPAKRGRKPRVSEPDPEPRQPDEPRQSDDEQETATESTDEAVTIEAPSSVMTSWKVSE